MARDAFVWANMSWPPQHEAPEAPPPGAPPPPLPPPGPPPASPDGCECPPQGAEAGARRRLLLFASFRHCPPCPDDA